MDGARRVLQSATWKKSEENENSEVTSVNVLGDEVNDVDLSAETTIAYGSSIYTYNVYDTGTVDSYSFEVESLTSLYPSQGTDRQGVTARLLHSVILAKVLGSREVEGKKALLRAIP